MLYCIMEFRLRCDGFCFFVHVLNYSELKLDNRIEQFNQREALVTLEDHKANFQNDPKCELIKPAKSKLGKITKYYS